MVYYYSATGNTRYAAELIARQLGTDCADLLGRIKNADYSDIRSDEPFVICTPVYVCMMPGFVYSYLERTAMKGSRKVYFVFTSGGYAGMSGSQAKALMQRKGMDYMGHAEIKMPTNHIVSDAYPPTPDDECRRRILAARRQCRETAAVIKCGGRLTARHVFAAEKAIILPFNPVWTRFCQPSRDFHVTDRCTGCGKCVRVCPLNNITMTDRRPVWSSPCAHCMACICGCPREAIEYGDITQHKQKYNILKYVKNMPLEEPAELFRGGTAHINGTEIYYTVCGRGRPLIMLHGNGEDHSIFDSAVSVLRTHFTCICPDTRGHGKSAPVKEYHYKDMAKDVTALIDHLRLEDVVLFGFSDGGISALMAAARDERIGTLIVGGANTDPEGIKLNSRILFDMEWMFTRDPRLALMSNEPHITREELARIRARTLVLAGENDLITEEHTRNIAAAIPRARLKILRGEDHGSYIVHSRKIARIIERFMKVK